MPLAGAGPQLGGVFLPGLHRIAVPPFDYPYQFTFFNGAEMGTQGTAVTGVNSQGTTNGILQSGAVSINAAGGSVTFDNTHAAHGNFSYLINNNANGNTFFEWGITGSFKPFAGAIGGPITGPIWTRQYMYLTGYPSSGSTNFLLRMPPGNNGVQVSTTGICSVVINGNNIGANASSTGVLPLFTWLRIECNYQMQISNTGYIFANVYLYDSVQPIMTLSKTLQGVPGYGIQDIIFGNPSPNGPMPQLWMDDLAASTFGWIGPAGNIQPYSDDPSSQNFAPALRALVQPWQQRFRTPYDGVQVGAVNGVAAQVVVAGGVGTPVGGANIAGVGAAVTVAGGVGTLSAGANVVGVGTVVTVAGGVGTPSGGAAFTGTGAAVTIAGGVGTPAAGATVTGVGAAITVAGGAGTLLAGASAVGVGAAV